MLIWNADVATAKIADPPAAPIRKRLAAVRRGPIVSKDQPIGICIAANAKNHRPDAFANISGLMPISVLIGVASTARKARKN